MRRLMYIAAFALLLALPVRAQRSGRGFGGHVTGGIRGGGFAGHAGGGHSFGGMHPGMRSNPGFSRGFNHSFHQDFRQGFFRGRGFRHHGGRNFVLRNNCNGFGCWNSWGWGNPWWGVGYYDPLWWSWEEQDRRFDDDYYRQYEMADRMNRQSLEQQRMWRQEEADGDQDVYAPRSSRSQSAHGNVSEDSDPAPATVLVFRDQHQQEVQNYAIVGQTLWAFSSGRTQKIPLADLDVNATEKANDDRGVSFRVPGVNQGQ